MATSRRDRAADWGWPAALGALFVVGFFVAPSVGPVAALLNFFANAAHPVVHYFYRDRENLYLPAWGVRVAFFLYPAVFCFALAGAAAFGRVRLNLPARPFAGRRKYFWLYGAALAVLLATAWFVFGGEPREFDETAYLLQARIFAHGRLWAERPPCERRWASDADELNNFFVGLSRLEVLNGDKWFTIYSPLHPLFLAVGFLIRLPWIINPLVGALAPPFLAALTARAVGREAVPWATALALTSPFWLFNAASFMSEGTWLPIFVLFLILYWRALEKPTRGRFLAAGAALGLAVVDREWATFVSAAPFLAYAGYLVLRRKSRAPNALWLFAGAVPFLTVYYLYNIALTGDPLKLIRSFSFQKHFGFDEVHTPSVAVNWVFRNLYTLSSDTFGWPLLCLAPLAAYPFVVRPLPLFAKLVYAGFGTVFVGNLFIENAGIIYGPRYYMGLYPGTLVLTAHLAASLPGRLAGGRWFARRPAASPLAFTQLLLVLLIAVNLSCYLPFGINKHHGFPFKYKPWATARLEEAMAAARPGPSVVFIKPRELYRGPMPNDPTFRDEIIYARDQAWRDVELMKCFPKRRFFLCDYATFDRTGVIVELEPPAGVSYARK